MSEAKQKYPNVYLLGGNWMQRHTVIGKIKKSLGKFELSVYDDQISYDYLRQSLLESSCFDSNKLIIINDWPITDKKKAALLNDIKLLIPNIPLDSTVIFNDPPLEKNKLFIDFMKNNCRVKMFEQKVDIKDVKDIIISYLKASDKSIGDNEVEFLSQSFHCDHYKVDLDEVFLSLKKLKEYLGNRKQVKNEDIFNVCTHDNEFIVWNLYNALDNKDLCSCFPLINLLVSFGNNIKNEVIGALGSMSWRYKILLMVCDYISSHKNQEEIWQEMSKINKLTRTGSKFNISMSPAKTKPDKNKEAVDIMMYSKNMVDSLFYSHGTNKPAIKCYDKKELLLINYIITCSVEKVRFGCTDFEALLTLEMICMAICEANSVCIEDLCSFVETSVE